jgi:hypothetical protein
MTVEVAVIDAQIVKGLSLEEKNLPSGLSDVVGQIIDVLISRATPVCSDDGGLIEAEWRGCCDPDWIENWIVTFSSLANYQLIPARPQPQLIKKLRIDYGFPSSRDRILVATSVAASMLFGRCTLLTEDMDFYEPSEKSAPPARRGRYMRGQLTGRVKRHLGKEAGIDVRSVVLALDVV